jgi:predicted TPR repeat methyltransferase
MSSPSADDLDTLVRYADSLRENNRHGEAIDAYRRAIEFGAARAPVEFALASLGASPEPPLAPPQYVREHFDAFADAFDRHLTMSLRYRVPELLCKLLFAELPERGLDVLDLGCGTGLCAPMLQPYARRLVGIDLSERMLAQARARGGYDELRCEDIVEGLTDPPASFDLILAADVFVYVGDLAPLFAVVQSVLRPGGRFAFSIETNEKADFALASTMRYTHSRAYLDRLTAGFGLKLEAIERHAIRQEDRIDVPGDIVVLRRG